MASTIRPPPPLSESHGLSQMIYYDSGVGTLPELGWLPWIGEKLSRCWSLAFGAGLTKTKNVEEAYAYLMDVWDEGDRVFLFG